MGERGNAGQTLKSSKEQSEAEVTKSTVGRAGVSEAKGRGLGWGEEG